MTMLVIQVIGNRGHGKSTLFNEILLPALKKAKIKVKLLNENQIGTVESVSIDFDLDALRKLVK
jgi:hypothetical protein